MQRVKVSIIICTRNRAESLRQTLESIGRCEIPADTSAELLVVDNGSVDHTREVVEQTALPNMRVRYVLEPKKGKCQALNRGLAEATGEIIVFTDDDVRVPETWIEGMCGPIGRDDADAVAGGVVLAPHILQPWMETAHRTWLASTEWFTEDRFIMVGANMSFARRVLAVVGQFDVELGPGALGTFDDHWFCQMIRRAGFKVVAKPLVAVTHFPDPRRITARAYRDLAKAAGRSDAYIDWHFRGVTIKWPHLRFARAVLRLWSHRVWKLSELLRHPAIPAWEFRLCRLVAHRTQYLKERHRKRKYLTR